MKTVRVYYSTFIDVEVDESNYSSVDEMIRDAESFENVSLQEMYDNLALCEGESDVIDDGSDECCLPHTIMDAIELSGKMEDESLSKFIHNILSNILNTTNAAVPLYVDIPWGGDSIKHIWYVYNTDNILFSKQNDSTALDFDKLDTVCQVKILKGMVDYFNNHVMNADIYEVAPNPFGGEESTVIKINGYFYNNEEGYVFMTVDCCVAPIKEGVSYSSDDVEEMLESSKEYQHDATGFDDMVSNIAFTGLKPLKISEVTPSTPYGTYINIH